MNAFERVTVLRSLGGGDHMLFIGCVVLALLLPKIGLVDLSVIPLSILCAFSLFRNRIEFDRRSVIPMVAFATILAGAIISSAVNGLYNLDVILKPIRNLIIVTSVIIIGKDKEYSIEDVLSGTLIAGVINSFVVLVQLIVDLGGGDNSFLTFYPLAESYGAMRQQGLSSGFPSSALLSVMGFSIALFKYIDTGVRKYLVLFILSIPGVIFSARTGTLFSGGIFALLGIYGVLRGQWKYVAKVTGVSVALSALLLVFAFFDKRLSYLLYVMFEFVVNATQEKRIGVGSTDDLFQNHYFVPENVGVFEWIFGNARGAWGGGGIPSDVWFTQTLLGSGILGVSVYLFVFFYLIFSAIKISSHKEKIIIGLLTGIVLASSIKGGFIFSRFVSDPLTILGGLAIGLRSKGGLEVGLRLRKWNFRELSAWKSHK